MSEGQYIYPWDNMYTGLPLPYLQPYQSRYHNLGLNGYTNNTADIFSNAGAQGYPYKRPGFQGDWGPRQMGCYDKSDAYPLDRLVMESQGIDPNSTQCGLIRDTRTSPYK